MCSGSKGKPCIAGLVMENCESKQKKGVLGSFSVLLELCATDDLVGFKIAVEEEGHDIDEPSCWYGRRIGSNKMGFEERTPLMIAAMFGSKQILSYVLETGAVDVNRACGLDGATALHCAVAGGSASSPDVVKLLLNASADTNSLDANGNRPGDLMVPYLNSSFNSRRIECLLTGSSNIGEECVLPDHAIKPMEEQVDQQILIPATSKDGRLPSPTSFSNGASSLDMTSISPITLGSPSRLVPPASTPPMTPLGASPMNGSMWQKHPNIVPPALQLSRSRLKTASSARDMDLDAELLGLESYRRRQQQLMDEISSLSSPTSWNNTLAPASAYAASSVDQSGDVQSPTGMQIRQNINQHIRSSHPASLSSSPVRSFPSFGIDPSGAASAAVLNSRAAAFAKRSQSFIDRSTVNRLSGLSSPASSANVMPSTRSNWGSADGKLDWAIQKEELNKLRKSASFGLRSSSSSSMTPTASMLATGDDPDVSWGQSLAKNAPSVEHGHFGFEEQHRQHHLNIGGSEMLPSWVEQLYMEQEQIVA
ncbi:zinc finger (CCCH-type) family protein [Actinidia rufa]|uniref:Zinc finger (CCCH-type) family protein n=1 Tax=Actinidia rufa TaxID=165716 RepID=A0A7J0FTV9_9ERIC|nr:zinc finger (CCCH-type) family protein [Actinidia rufa]